MNNKRSVLTDALETLGTLIDEHQKRDAIHLAVEPVIAGEYLCAGDHIGFGGDGLVYGGIRNKKPLGIVDPFLDGEISKGDRFWMIIYPRQITSLRHVWEHPDFQEEYLYKNIKECEAKKSWEWLDNYASSLGSYTSYDILEAAKKFIESGEHYLGKGKDDDFYFPDFKHVETNPEFWIHFENVTNSSVTSDKKTNFFSCSC